MQLTLSSHKIAGGFSAYIGKLLRKNDRADRLIAHDPVGRSNSPTFGHFKIPHHEGRVTER